MLNSEELWLEVSKYIDEVYDVDKVETIYLSGDGAAKHICVHYNIKVE